MNTIPRLLAGTASLALLGGLTFLTAFSEETSGTLDSLQPREVRANTYTFSAQEDPSIAIDAEGRILATWSSRRQEVGNYGVFAQLLDPLGRPLGTELHVNQTLPGAQQDSYATFGPDGSAWVVWSSMYRRTPQNGIFLRRLADTDEGFAPVGDEIWVGGEPQEIYDDPAIAVNERGEMLVAYVKNEFGHITVVGRRLAPDGMPVGDPFRLGELEQGRETVPDVAALPGGDFVAVWQAADEKSVPLGLVGRRVCSDGGLGETFAVHDLEGLQHLEPSVDVDGSGRVLVAWMANAPDAYDYHARARRFGPDLEPLGASFSVGEDAEGHQNGAIALCADDGRFLVAYNLHTGTYTKENGKAGRQCDIWAQAFDSSGALLGDALRVNDAKRGFHTLNSSRARQRADWSGDSLVFTWSGDAIDDGSGVAVRILTPRGFDVPAPPAVEPLAACTDLVSADTGDVTYPDPLPAWAARTPRVPPPNAPSADGFVAHDQTAWIPPDPDVAVGPDMIISQVNMEIAAFTKAGVEMWRQDNTLSGGFYGSLGAGDFVFDPVSAYDWHTQRFVVANSELGSQDYVCFAVSKDSHPDDEDDWWKYRVQVSPTCAFPDFPNLGISRDHISITTDCFSGGGNRVMIFDKANVMNGTLGTWWNQQMSSSLQTLGNVKNYDAGNAYMYFVTSFGSAGNYLRLQCKKTPTASPNSFNLPVSSYDYPAYAPQQGSSTQIWTIDTRIKHGVVRNGHLYCAHGIGSGGITRVRWYEIDLGNWPDSGSPTLVQEGEIDLGSGVYTWFPDISPDAAGNITVSYNRSASNEPISIEAAYQLVGDAPGSMRAPIQLQVSTTPYNYDRWGDYSGLDEDPAEPGTFWSHLEYSVGPWETWVDKWTVSGGGTGTPYCFGDGSGTPCPCGNNNDGSVPGSGCANGAFASGARLTGTGVASISADTVVLAGTGLDPNNSGLYFQADNDLSPGVVWGDGLQCAGGDLKRLGVRFSDASGASDTSAWATPISVRAGNVSAGDTKRYQLWYRDNSGGQPCGVGVNDFNATNGIEIVWAP